MPSPRSQKTAPQAFGPNADRWLRGGAGLALFATLVAVASAMIVFQGNRQGPHKELPQPVLFSHRHHAGELGIDCRYCHTSVEKSAFAGMPTTATCLSCHRGLFRSSEMLAPVWESLEESRPLAWTRVHDLMDVAYFNHSIHVTAGVSCQQCHGEVSEMITVHQKEPLTMQWCLECHRDPAKTIDRSLPAIPNLRALDPEATASTWQKAPVKTPSTANLTDCSTCHR